LRVTAEERQAWQRPANLSGLSLSAYVRRRLEETQTLEHALERQVEKERTRQNRRRRVEAEQVSRPKPHPPQPKQRMGARRPWGVTVGEALARAEGDGGRGPIP
jgi:hypothetical protein